ncbi:MAG TPA: DNA/RNA non-specific endonuclease [Flavobacterium sp.]
MENSRFPNSVIILFGLLFFSSCKKDAAVVDSIGNQIESSQYGSEGNRSHSEAAGRYGDTDQTFDFLPFSGANQIVKHEYYTLSYNEKYEQAEWVAYELKESYLKNNSFKRPFFIEDPKVKTGSADWRNYKNSGYDKGHLCPAGDMEFAFNAFADTFFTSNIAPQVHDFNSGVWNRLEQKVRYWAAKYNGIYVVTGGVLEPSLKTIGKEGVSVPNYFYKVLLDTSEGKFKMIAFLVPNAESSKPLYDFVVSVDRVEKVTGIDFFPKLEDRVEDQLEKNSDYKNWVK